MNRKELLIGTILFILTGTVIGAYAGTVGVNNLFGFTNGYGFTWLNSTNISADDIYVTNLKINNVDYPTNFGGLTVYIGFDVNQTIYDNYYLCDGVADGAQVQAALDYLMFNGGGNLYAGEGIYDISDQNLNLTNPYHVSLSIYGEGWGNAEYNLGKAICNGTIFNFTAPYGLVDQDDGGTSFGWLHLKNLGLAFYGEYTAGNRPIVERLHINHWDTVRVSVEAGIPNNANAFLLGSTGPPAEAWVYRNVQWIDLRKSGNYSYLARFYGEYINLEHNSLITNVATTSTGAKTGPFIAPRLFRLNQVTESTIEDFLIFTGGTWDGDGTQYDYMWYYGDAAEAHWTFDTCEWLASADVIGGHLSTSNGDIHVSGSFPTLHEGGTTPMDLDLGGVGTIYVEMIGDGYTVSGSATIPNNEDSIAVTHGLVGTPTSILAMGTTADTNALISTTIGGTTFNITAAGNVGGARTVYYWAAYNNVG